jgi:nitroreductase
MTTVAGNNPVYDAIRSRRVTRNMDGTPVDPRDFELVVRAARYAPNAGNRRLQPVVAVRDPQTVRLLRMVAPGMLVRPQAAIVICIDEQRAAVYGFRRDAPGLYIDVGTTAATLLLAAHAVGLASCPVTSFSRAAVSRLLGLDDALTPRMVVCLGHAAADQPAPMGALLDGVDGDVAD